jgi:hypothetical protein
MALLDLLLNKIQLFSEPEIDKKRPSIPFLVLLHDYEIIVFYYPIPVFATG